MWYICRDGGRSGLNGLPSKNAAKIGITREEIRNLLKEAIEPLERKLDNLTNGFQELKRLVDFLNGKYDDVLWNKLMRRLKDRERGTKFP